MTGSARTAGSGGFTIVELLVSLLIFGVIMTVSLSFLQVQNQGFRKGLTHMTVLQNLRYSMGTLEQDVQSAGTNLPPGQPEIVYAGRDVIAFNADYATRNQGDPFAVFYDPDLEDEASASLPESRQLTLPNTSFTYPDTTYEVGPGQRSPAETLIFFFVPDTTTSRSDDYALYRQVNDGNPQLVARNLLPPQGAPFFRYFRDTDTGIDSIPASLLPLAHSVPIHGSAADTGAVALVDSITAVRVSLQATNGRTDQQERTAFMTRVVRLPNMGFATLETCGSPPILGTGISAALVTVSGAPAVELTWGQATDEGGGEEDVVRYVLFRRPAGSSDWGEPYLSIPAGETSYTYVDGDVEEGESYQYGLSAQDCTPSLSNMSSTADITVPTS